MAAGKVSGYRGNELRDRESGVSRRYYKDDDYYRRDVGHRREHGGRYMHHKDSRKMEEVDHWCYTSLSAGKSGSSGGNRRHGQQGSRGRYDCKTKDRESGELSSESGSDGSVRGREKPVEDVEVRLSAKKKMKYSPTMLVDSSSFVASPPGLSSSLHEECHGGNDRKPEQPEEEEFFSERKISGSRWADEDEGEILEEEDIYNRGKSKPSSGSTLSSLCSKVLSPESGELPSAYNRGSDSHVKYENDVEEVNEDEDNGERFYGSDSDLDAEYDFPGSPEPSGSQPSINMLHSCRSVHEFERLNTIGSGTYGIVFQARDKRNGEIVALKKVKMEKEREGFPLTSLREINILLSMRHPSIVNVKEVVVDEDLKKGKSETYLVMEYMEHDLKGLIEVMKYPFSQSEVKCLMLQLLEGVEYLHDNWVLHRDLKTSNLLYNNRGELKICDFGLSRQYGSPLKQYTPLVVTLWYRAPELLLGAEQYSTAIDMWSLGCIMAELLAKEPLFSGKSEIDQLDKIFKILGTPNETTWTGFSKLPGAKVNYVKQKSNLLRQKFPPASFTGSPILSASGFDLLSRLLMCDPAKRITAKEAVNHEWFREVPLPKSKDFMPTFPAQHTNTRRLHRIMKSPDPIRQEDEVA